MDPNDNLTFSISQVAKTLGVVPGTIRNWEKSGLITVEEREAYRSSQRETVPTAGPIRLNPEHLGELTLRVAVTASGAINATFHTENAQVRGLLESSMIQLKQELQQQGLKVNNVDVQSGLSQDFFAQSQAGQQGYPQPQHSARNQAADRRSFENDADALTVNTAVSGVEAAENPASVGDADGVNYLV